MDTAQEVGVTGRNRQSETERLAEVSENLAQMGLGKYPSVFTQNLWQFYDHFIVCDSQGKAVICRNRWADHIAQNFESLLSRKISVLTLENDNSEISVFISPIVLPIPERHTLAVMSRYFDSWYPGFSSECGCVGDFHALRHTYGTMFYQAGVPLATAQKLMRHSDPKLTANIYTHVLVETKAEALAKLPMIEATPEKQKIAKTGTDDLLSQDASKIVVSEIDSFSVDSMANIKTYMDNSANETRTINRNAETQKPPVSQGEKLGGERGIRTPGGLPHSGFQDRRLRPLGHLSARMRVFIHVVACFGVMCCLSVVLFYSVATFVRTSDET